MAQQIERRRHRFRSDARKSAWRPWCTLSKCGFVRHCSKNTGCCQWAGRGRLVAKRNVAKPEKAGKNEGGRVVPAAAFSLE